jgi:colicin import membrane protein
VLACPPAAAAATRRWSPRWTLNPDGSLEKAPEVERPRGDALFQLAAEAAIRAVQQCSPFPLPRDKYVHWKTITWEFDPSQMM